MKYVAVDNPALFGFAKGDMISFYLVFGYIPYVGKIVETGRYCMRIDIDGTHIFVKYSDLRCVNLICK